MQRLVVIGFALFAMASSAMPTRSELAKAQKMVSEVTAPDVKALKAGSKKPAEVAATHLALAEKADSEAEKYLLLQGAFCLYVKDGDYDRAAQIVERMQLEIKNFNPEVIVELCGKQNIRKMKETAPRLYALKENARRIVFYRKQLPVREKAAKVKPTDAQAQKKLGECHAELGNWPKALVAFAKAGGELAKMASGESAGTVKAQALADFWWDYESKSETPVYRLHAAEWYRRALADSTFQGLVRERAERRVKEVGTDDGGVTSQYTVANNAEPVKQSVPEAKNKGGESAKDLSSETLAFELAQGVKLELESCPAGTFQMSGVPGSDGDRKHEVKLTRAFWIADVCVNTKMYRAFDATYQPKDAKKDLVQGRKCADEYVQWLNEKFASKLPRGYVFRLPTEAEWEYAAGLGKFAKHWEFEGMLDTVVGLFEKPSSWRGNLSALKYEASETDPLRVREKNAAWVCRQNAKRFLLRLDGPACFRVVVGPDLLSEKRQ